MADTNSAANYHGKSIESETNVSGVSKDLLLKTPRGITDPKIGLLDLAGNEKEIAPTSGDGATNKIALSTSRVEENAAGNYGVITGESDDEMSPHPESCGTGKVEVENTSVRVVTECSVCEMGDEEIEKSTTKTSDEDSQNVS